MKGLSNQHDCHKAMSHNVIHTVLSSTARQTGIPVTWLKDHSGHLTFLWPSQHWVRQLWYINLLLHPISSTTTLYYLLSGLSNNHWNMKIFSSGMWCHAPSLLLWWRRHEIPLKRWYISTTLQEITSQEGSKLKNPTMRTTNHFTCSSQQTQPALVNLPVNEVHSLKPSAQFHFMSLEWLKFPQL